MEDLSALTNDQLFKLCKKSGINAGPITPTTRSVYEKKLRNCLGSKTEEEESTQITNLKADLPESELPKKIQVPPSSIRVVEPSKKKERSPSPILVVEPPRNVFVKPAEPKPKETPQEVTQKPIKSILRVDDRISAPERRNTPEPTLPQAINLNKIDNLRKEIDRESPQRASTVESSSTATKGAPRMEFKLLKKDQDSEIIKNDSTSTPSNIRKRTATFEKPAVVRAEQKTKQSGGSGFLGYMIMVVLVTAIAYFAIIHFQLNPENPVD